MRPRDHFAALKEKKRQNALKLSVVTNKGKIIMSISNHVTRRDIPELERVLQEIRFRCKPHPTDSERQSERRWQILDAFLRQLREETVHYRGTEWTLAYVINRLLPGSPVLVLREYLDDLEAKISNALNELIEFDPDEIARAREMRESSAAKATEAAIKKLLDTTR